MSRADVEVVVSQFEAVNRRDFQAAMDRYAEDVVLVTHGDLWGAGGEDKSRTEAGKGPVGDWFGDWFRTFGGDYRLQVVEARDAGDRVFLVVAHRGRGRISGAPIHGQLAYVYTVEDGKVTRVEIWDDRDDHGAALRAAGLA